MKDEKRKNDRFRALVEAYGVDPARWPAEERHLFDEEEAGDRAWLAEQRRLDELLESVDDLQPSPALLRSVAEIPLRNPVASRAGIFGRARRWIALGALAAAAGVAVGVAIPDSNGDDATWDDLSTLAFGADYSEDLAP